MEQRSRVLIFIDDQHHPIAELETPVNFQLNTHKLVDGDHTLKIVSKDHTGKEGIRIIPFSVKNGPAIDIEGIKEKAVVDGLLSIRINAYGKADQKTFLVVGSETPQSIPYWVWITIIVIFAWAMYYLIRYL
ncbi:cytochrome C [Myroides sp. M-43]|uniref:cytochrome C n=1 Tax=Myroides oncorhynchi TaxID=2893756 RepID=UPI001E62D75F|nr:cytochrome C [Myroides oncorhynchi]MCC9043636.1 cytochrome C [Myroides oncorhynchi]